MNVRDIASIRLTNQQIASSASDTPCAVVAGLLAMQAQDYRGALWSIGLRLPGSNVSQIEQTIAARTIVRTWPMRRTLHFVAAEDARWMLRLLTPRMIKGMAGRLAQLEIDNAVMSRSRRALEKAFRDRSLLVREEVYDALARAKISPANQRGIHIISRLSQEGLLCFGPHRGNAPTFVLMDEWIPPSRDLDRDEALALLTARYFRGHGPATVRDLAWWAGITLGDARAGVAMMASELEEEIVEGNDVHSFARGARGERGCEASRARALPASGIRRVHARLQRSQHRARRRARAEDRARQQRHVHADHRGSRTRDRHLARDRVAGRRNRDAVSVRVTQRE